MTTTDPRTQPRPAWRHWLGVLLATVYLVAFTALSRDLPASSAHETGTTMHAASSATTTHAAPARPVGPPRVADLDRTRDARPAPASSVAPEPRSVPTRVSPTRRSTRRIRTRSS